MVPAIVLSSHVTGLGVIRTLGKMGVPIVAIYYQKCDFGYVSKYVKKRIYAPHPEKYEEDFIKLLVSNAKRFGGGVLIPADDETLSSVSRNKSILENYYYVACPEWDITKLFINKKYTYEIAEKLRIPFPKTIIPNSINDLKNCEITIQFPCLVKPLYSHKYYAIFGKKMAIVENYSQLYSHYLEAREHELEVMLQEFIPGEDTSGVNYCSYYCNGNPVSEFTAQKIRLSPTTFGVPRIIVSKKIPDLSAPAKKILNAMNFSGYSCVEFKKDKRDSLYKLMDINGRPNRSILHSMKCGVNFPWLLYNHLSREQLCSVNCLDNEVYWVDITKDIISSISCRKNEKYGLIDYFKPYLRSNIFSIFHIKDIKPFCKRLLHIIGKGWLKFLAPVKNRIMAEDKNLI
jgi:predicted ATP-grasp superfamily ATP-dependent carboligase